MLRSLRKLQSTQVPAISMQGGSRKKERKLVPPAEVHFVNVNNNRPSESREEKEEENIT